LAQLKLLHRAAERRRAQGALLDLKVVQTAVASCMAKENAGAVKTLAAELMKML
jgi:hypothetical protein